MQFLATTTIGLEDVAIKELNEFGIKAEKIGNGRIIFDTELEKGISLNFFVRSINRIILLLGIQNVENLNEIKEFTSNFDFKNFISKNQTFAVRAERKGEHDFTSIEVAREVGGVLHKQGFKVNLDNPDIIIRAFLDEEKFFLGIDTTGDDSLHKRGYRVYQHPASLKPTIAYALVKLSEWSEDYSLLDPMCGGGTIPIEAVLYSLKIPPFKFRKVGWAFEKFNFFKIERLSFENVVEKDLDVFGFDKFKKHVLGAKENAKSAGVEKFIKFDVVDACEFYKKIKPDFVIANPPYGLRIASKRAIEKLYSCFASALRKADIKKAVILTAEGKLMRKFLEEENLEVWERIIMYGNLRTSVIFVT